ncbi:g10774 [Coccomyxa viridis]|uniref:G10774 protein n=1 Tax=Coccomyxa viridis TaxID=1274662 RepID=A0ABP1G8S7_9CHLO
MWILEATGEVFSEYSDYLKALYLTKSRVWSSVYTGVSNLTYQEAVLEDERGRALARKFPKDLEAQALQHVHFGTLRLDDLIEYIYNALKPRQPTGALQGRENDGQPLKLKHPAPRPVIRCWLFEVALHDQVGGCQNFWRAKPEYVQQYDLATVIPQDVQEVLAVARARQRPKRGGGSRKRSRTADPSFSRAASEAPSESGSMDWAASSQAGEEEDILPNGTEPTPAPPSFDEPIPSVEEEEAKLKPGTDKHIAFQCLKDAGAAGLNITQIIDAAKQNGVKDLDENSKRVIQYALANDPAFQRIAKGIYTLRALAPEINSPVPQPKTKGQRTPRPPPPRFDPSALAPEPSGSAFDDAAGDDSVPLDFLDGSSVLAPMPAGARPEDVHVEEEYVEAVKEEAPENGEAMGVGPGAAMDAALARLNRAEEDVAALREAIKAAQAKARLAMPKKKKKGEDAVDENPVFEVPAEEKLFKGDPNDRKALLRHKQHVKELEEEMESSKQAWLKKQRSLRDKASGNKSKEVQALNKQLQAALQVLDVERYHVAACEEAAMTAEKGHGRGRRGSWARKYEYEDPLKAAEREERDRRRAEVRRYPIDDTELHAELRDKASDGGDTAADDMPVGPLETIDAVTSHAMSATMFVADFASTFHHPLGLPRAVNFKQLQDAIAAEGQLDGREVLWELYEGLMRFLLNNTTGRTERRWLNCLGAATWPEVVRRYCLFHMAKYQDPQITNAAGLLGDQGCETLEADLHRSLLCHLCDEALDREPLRVLLTRRMDWAENVRKDMRDAAAEDKGRIKELIEARKEERKRKRAEGKGRISNAASWDEDEQKVKMEGADSGFGAFENGDGPEHRYSGGLLGEDSAAEDVDMADAEQQRGGNKRKGKGGKGANPKAEANRELERQQAEMEDATIRRQEEFERALEDCCIRREPLGWDRQHRCYWWGVAGERALVHVQAWDGRMGAISTPDHLDALMDALEPRGVREHGLQASLEKMYHSITNAMTLGPGEMLEPISYGQPPQQLTQSRRSSKRGDRGGVAEIEVVPEKPPQQVSAEKPRPACLAGVEGLAILTSADFLLDIQRLALDNDIEPSPSCFGGWKVWAQAVRSLGQGTLPLGSSGPAVPILREAMKSRLIQMEEALFIASGQRFEAESEAAAEAAYLSNSAAGGRDSEEREGSQERLQGDGDADGNGASSAEDGAPGGEGGAEDKDAKPQGGGLRMWRAARDRAAWKADVLHATTAARVAYSAVALTIIGYPLLDKIEAIRTAPAPKPRSGGVTAELEAAAAAGAAAAAAALKAGARAKKGLTEDDTINTRNKATRR